MKGRGPSDPSGSSVLSCDFCALRGGASRGFQLFMWKIRQPLINTNARINSVFHVFTSIVYFCLNLYISSDKI